MIEMSEFAKTIMDRTYAHDLPEGGKESWEQIASRVTKNVMRSVEYDMRHQLSKDICRAITERKFIPGGRYLYASGRQYHQVNNCLLMDVHDSREGWSELLCKASMALMSGAGIGVVYSNIRPRGAPIRKTGGVATGPLSLMQILNECGRGIMQGGNRRSAIWAGLRWNHPDVFEFIVAKDWPDEIQRLKERDFSFPAPLDQTNLSVILDDLFFEAYGDYDHPNHSLANNVYWAVVKHMVMTGEPAFSVDTGKNSGEVLRNACTEVTSRDSDDICNLASLNLARIESIEELRELVNLATAFLLAGTVYSDVPYSDVDKIRSRNRRLGLGIMGVHEWLLQRGKRYAPDDELGKWLSVYAKSGRMANKWADEWGLSRPKKTRAIAPTGTIGIVAETTTGIEPIFCVAYKRRYLKGDTHCYQYVVDPTAKRLIESGVDPASIEDAYHLAEDVERRIKFQAWVQKYVDHGISSTINLPGWGTKHNNNDTVGEFGRALMDYLPSLRGITCYPDGARGGQPLTPCSYEEASSREGHEVVEETTDVCEITKGGSCGA
jgi:ribonucleoside-diphosphate reductase alpha chain